MFARTTAILFVLFAAAGVAAQEAPRRPQLPPAGEGATHPLDRILAAYWKAHDVKPPPLAEDAVLLRRLHLDVIGLLPTPKEVAAFEADPSPNKRENIVRAVLARDRDYAEHWLTFFNDMLRNDYVGTGYIDGGRKQITGWLYRSLLENKPYDRFARELLSPDAETEGFIRGIQWRGNVNASQTREVQFAQSVSQVFLGVNMKCASCHDSFINSWKLADAYGLAAIVSDKPLEIHRCDKPTGATAKAAFLFPKIGSIDPTRPKAERLKRFAELMTHEKNGRFAHTIVNRIWQRMMGRGVIHPVDEMENEAFSADCLDYLAVQLADNNYDLKQTMQLIATSQAYQAKAVDAPPGEEDFVFRGPLFKRLTAEQFFDAVWRITGSSPGKPAFNFGDRGGAPVRASLVVSDVLMRSLGRPNREQIVTTRPDELSTLQAIDLANGEEFSALLARGAKSLLKQHPDWQAADAARTLYLLALCREPTPAETAAAAAFSGDSLDEEGLSDLLWMVFMLPEFQLVR